MENVMDDWRFWRDLRAGFHAERARLRARYDEATRRHRAIMDAYFAEAAPPRRFRVPLPWRKRKGA
jgi:hypothetical protein